MKIRFQADANLNPAIGKGLLQRERRIEWRPAHKFIPEGMPDPAVLRFAAEEGRVLVSRDIRTIPEYFAAYIAACPSPGVILIPYGVHIGQAIERLLKLWLQWEAKDIANQIWWLTI